MNNMQPDETVKNRLNDLRKQSDSLIIDNNLQSEAILEISREIDTLILKFYPNCFEGKDASNF